MKTAGVGLALALALAGCHSPKKLAGADDLHRAARDTASIARESALLVDQVQRGHVGADYVWVHQQALQEDARRAAEPLHRAAPDALRGLQQQVEAASARLSAGLEHTPLATAGPDELARLAQVFAQAGAQAAALRGDK
ncbi:hypothetical protein [Caenimonas aquaedulcis]|uniref:Lipoprotein n=1 Tax=Caenimonas aquaedulcis TaxID=2793270 RepID=A0A931MFY1_9BURK|nr:hypothetical protein [Caenimonas aquaedulcis]MBG9387618.1 hypothetical protein [Caenimonas aquaedulcis]